jgi:hypothetical protein
MTNVDIYKLIFEKAGPADLFPADKVAGYVCEIALTAAIEGMQPPSAVAPKNIPAFFSSDNGKVPVCPASSLVYKKLSEKGTNPTYALNCYKFYVNTFKTCVNSLNSYSIGGNRLGELIGSDVVPQTDTTAPFDVMTDTANIHVKLNQSSPGTRVIGTGKAEGDDDAKELETQTGYSSVFEAWQREKLGSYAAFGGAELVAAISKEMQASGKLQGSWTSEETKILARVLFERWVSKETGRLKGRKEAKHAGAGGLNYTNDMRKLAPSLASNGSTYTLPTSWEWFEWFKGAYKATWIKYFKQAVTVGPLKNVGAALLKDVHSKISGESDPSQKPVLWAYFDRANTQDLSPTLTIKAYKFQSIKKNNKPINIVVGYKDLSGIGDPDGGEEKMPRTVVYVSLGKGSEAEMVDPANELFTIELRTDGDNKPPQIKVGRGLASATPGDGSLIGEMLSVATPA